MINSFYWIYTYFWAYKNFLGERLKPVRKFSIKGVFVCYILSIMSMILMYYLSTLFLKDTATDISPEILKINPLWVFLAGYEDFVYVLPVFLLNKRWRLIGLVTSTVLFALSHSYQGDIGVLTKVAWVPIVYLIAGRYGIYSTAVSHGIHDVIAVALLQYLYKI